MLLLSTISESVYLHAQGTTSKDLWLSPQRAYDPQSFNVSNSSSISSMVYSIGNSFNVSNSPSIARIEIPLHELRTWILQEEVKTTTKMMDDIKATWKTTGVSLLSDGWPTLETEV
uniref:DUF659 domain-containing protein n=1 Tax=Lactuca sativa TaxID=4236 RepID=A0A9R1XTX6_LACSA|nr:hypothetical protein LSAT_V11C100006540 [Lactuca sativa]